MEWMRIRGQHLLQQLLWQIANGHLWCIPTPRTELSTTIQIWSINNLIYCIVSRNKKMMTPDDSCHPSTLPAIFLCWSDQLQPGGPWEWHPKHAPARCSSSSRWWHWARRSGWSELPAERGPVTKAPPSINATEGWEGDKVVMQGVTEMYVSAAKKIQLNFQVTDLWLEFLPH